MNNNSGNNNTPSFRPWQSCAIKCCIFVRFAMVILLHSRSCRQYASVLLTRPNSSLLAVLVDPWWTAHQLREDIYRDQLAYSHKLKFHDGLQLQREASMITLPNTYYFNTKSSSLGLRKLLLPILSIRSRSAVDSNHNMNMLLGMLLSCIDLFVSYYLYLVAKCTLWNVHVKAEQILEQSMDKSILPKKYYLFAIDTANPTYIQQPTSIIPYDHIPSFVSIIYFCSPISVISSCAALSCQSIAFALLLLTFHCAYMGQTRLTGLVLGMLVIVEQDLFFLFSISIPVLILLLRTARRRGNNNKVVVANVSASLIGTTTLSILFFSLFILYNSPTTNRQQHPIKMLLYLLVHDYDEERNLSPSLSLQWYFYQQVFHQFRLYFRIILEGVPYIFIIPLIIRLHRFPLSLVSKLVHHDLNYEMFSFVFSSPFFFISYRTVLHFFLSFKNDKYKLIRRYPHF
jgi:hypothetical protein